MSLATVWMQIGYNLLVLSAGLGAMDEEVLEAARLDGASGLRLQRSIVLPLITPQLFFLVVTGTIHSLQSFGQIRILTRGGPEGNTTTLVYSIFTQAFDYNNSNFGYALGAGHGAAARRPRHHRGAVRAPGAEGVLPVSGSTSTRHAHAAPNRGRRRASAWTYVILGVLFVLVVFPAYYAVAGSFMGTADSNSFPPALWPVSGFHAENYSGVAAS